MDGDTKENFPLHFLLPFHFYVTFFKVSYITVIIFSNHKNPLNYIVSHGTNQDIIYSTINIQKSKQISKSLEETKNRTK